MNVDLIDHMGSDERIVRAARVSFNNDRAALTEDEIRGLIRFLLKNRHMSPFESPTVTFMVECPLFVRSEWHRHRTQSYSEVSGRYAKPTMEFYLPGSERPLVQEGKPGRYRFVLGTAEQQRAVESLLMGTTDRAVENYELLLSQGVAKEVARMVLPVNLMTRFYATANLRNWLQFLELRTHPTALYEIRLLAEQVREHLTKLFPVTMEMVVENAEQPEPA